MSTASTKHMNKLPAPAKPAKNSPTMYPITQVLATVFSSLIKYRKILYVPNMKHGNTTSNTKI